MLRVLQAAIALMGGLLMLMTGLLTVGFAPMIRQIGKRVGRHRR